MDTNVQAKPRMPPIENFADTGPVGVLNPCCTTPAGRIRHWAGRRPWRCGALARAAFSTRGLWTWRFAWTTLPPCPHAHSRNSSRSSWL